MRRCDPSPAGDERQLTPLEASTSSVSSSLCSMCISKGFPSRRYSWNRESSSWARPVEDAACLLGETEGERHWPMNLNSWLMRWGRKERERSQPGGTESTWTAPNQSTQLITSFWFILLYMSDLQKGSGTFLLRNAPHTTDHYWTLKI